MTKDEQRIAIAEVCGWKHCHVSEEWFGNPVGSPPAGWVGTVRDEAKDIADLPEYPEDLNALHEAEKVLTREQHNNYRDTLKDICLREAMAGGHYTPFQECATAAQRAEALLRTLNLWRDET